MARRSRPLLLLLLALASGGAAGLLALRYLREQATPLLALEPSNAKVVVAVRPLAMGSVVTEQDIKQVDWSGRSLPSGYLGRADDVVGRGLMVSVAENEPLLASKLAAKGVGGGLPVMIEDGMRADQHRGGRGGRRRRLRVAQHPGGRAAHPGRLGSRPGDQPPRSSCRTSGRLTAGSALQQDKDGHPMEVPVVTLLVTPEQAETLTLAANQGRIQLALRNTLDTMKVQTTGARIGNLMGGPSGRPALRRCVARGGRRPRAQHDDGRGLSRRAADARAVRSLISILQPAEAL